MFDETSQTELNELTLELPEKLFDHEDEEDALSQPDGEERLSDITGDVTDDPDEYMGVLPFKLFDHEDDEGKPTDGTLRVKFNGEMHDLPLDQAVEYAQKGMNYDRIFNARQRELKVLDALAMGEGISREEYLAMREGGGSPDVARWTHLLNQYPELDTRSLPAEFFTGIESGETPTEAYQRMKIKDLEAELSFMRLREKNRKSAIGSARGEASEREADRFLEGFFGAKY